MNLYEYGHLESFQFRSLVKHVKFGADWTLHV